VGIATVVAGAAVACLLGEMKLSCCGIKVPLR
jgi:hypothetical protein